MTLASLSLSGAFNSITKAGERLTGLLVEKKRRAPPPGPLASGYWPSMRRASTLYDQFIG